MEWTQPEANSFPAALVSPESLGIHYGQHSYRRQVSQTHQISHTPWDGQTF